MASMRSLLIAPRETAVSHVPSMALHHSSRFAPIGTIIPAPFLKYRPLRQPQFNRMGSTLASGSSPSTSNASPPTSLPATTAASSSRSLHSSSTSRLSQTADSGAASILPGSTTTSSSSSSKMAAKPPLSILPLQNIIRSLAVTTISSSPLLLTPSLAIMSILANTNNPILNPDRNPLLRFFIKSTFYAQFCAGENAAEVRSTIARLKGLGFSGVILCYAKEVVLTASQAKGLASGAALEGEALEQVIKSEVVPWAEGTLETVRLASEGDYVALKFSGAGQQALRALSERLPPPTALANAIDDICTLAAARGVRLFFDAEQQAVQHGIDDWTLHYMRKYNKSSSSQQTPAKAVIYGTYQTYLKASPAVVAAHLLAAKKEGFTLGLKLVRGAYLGSDPRHLIHDTKADTDACFDGIAEALLQRKWMGPLAAFAPPNNGGGDASLPPVEMVLASHSADSVRKARAVLDAGLAKTEVAFAQLQGMADEVSCAIIAPTTSTSAAQPIELGKAVEVDGISNTPKAYKYLVWGSTGECMKYLLRRAHENRDAVQRTRDGRNAMSAELFRRVKVFFGLA